MDNEEAMRDLQTQKLASLEKLRMLKLKEKKGETEKPRKTGRGGTRSGDRVSLDQGEHEGVLNLLVALVCGGL